MRRMSRGLLHLLLGGAAAAALVGLGVGMTMSLARASGAGRVLLALLGGVAIVWVARLLLSVPVRVVGASLARLSLDAQIPELTESHDREARVDGAIWALLAMLVGGACVFLLLLLVPGGISLAASAVLDEPLKVVGLQWHSHGVWRVLMVPIGVALAVAGVAVQFGGVLLLRRLAPRWLRPTSSELLAAERTRVQRLAAGNAIARDLHDSIGHALTAIGMQAEAGVVVGARDPAASTAAFAAIRDVAHDAVAELDRVLGALRNDEQLTDRHTLADLTRLAAEYPSGAVDLTIDGDLAGVSDEVSDTAYRIVQEAITNATRHGRRPIRARVVAAHGLCVDVTNSIDPESIPSDRSRGLSGMRERAEFVGGALSAGPDTTDPTVWRVRATLPKEPS